MVWPVEEMGQRCRPEISSVSSGASSRNTASSSRQLSRQLSRLVSLVGVWFSYSISQKTLDQSRQLTGHQHDMDLLARFGDFHFAGAEGRRFTFSVYIVDAGFRPAR